MNLFIVLLVVLGLVLLVKCIRYVGRALCFAGYLACYEFLVRPTVLWGLRKAGLSQDKLRRLHEGGWGA